MTTPTDLGMPSVPAAVDSFLTKLAGQMPDDVLFIGGPHRGEVELVPKKVDTREVLFIEREGRQYHLTGERMQHRPTGKVVRLARAVGVDCGPRCEDLPADGYLAQFICARGHSLA